MTDITIVRGDSVQEMSNLVASSVDLIIADPPYNLGKDYGNNHDHMKFDAYLSFSREWVKEAHRILAPNGTLFVFMGFRFISYLYEILERELHMFFKSWIVWHYTQGIGKRKGFSPRHDDILMFTKSRSGKFNLDAVRVPQKYYRERNNMRGANPGDVWEFSHVHYCNPNRQPHPTQKPEGLIERMVLAASDEGDLVLDPFSGSGTTLRVCQQLNRKAIGIELNPDYVSMTEARLSEPFPGFDSIDLRMERIPLDLRMPEIRNEYLRHHRQWFLSHHASAEKKFEEAVSSMYGIQIENAPKQLGLLDDEDAAIPSTE